MRRLCSNQGGFVLIATISLIAIVSVLMAAYLTIVSTEISAVHRQTGRIQAIYLAEAGLDSAVDLINQDWENYHDDFVFPSNEMMSFAVDQQQINIGDFTVIVEEIDEETLRITSTGRALPSVQNGDTTYGIERSLSIVVARVREPSFQRGGQPGYLDLEPNYFGESLQPNVLFTTGTLVETPGRGRADGILSSGSDDARDIGYHLAASFTDADLDGDMDLVLSDMPSQTGDRPRGGPFIPVTELTPEEDEQRPMSATAVDVFGTGQYVSFVAQGWLWLPENSLTGRGESEEIFINIPFYNGIRILSWVEL